MDTTNNPPTDVQPPVPQPVPQQQVQQPVSGGHKEHAPISTRSEYVAPAPAETVPQISQELRDLGIEASPDTDKPEVPPDAKQVGVTPVKTATPVADEGYSSQPQVQQQSPTPVPYQQAMTNLKTHKADESISWLSMLSKYIVEKLGLQKTV